MKKVSRKQWLRGAKCFKGTQVCILLHNMLPRMPSPKLTLFSAVGFFSGGRERGQQAQDKGRVRDRYHCVRHLVGVTLQQWVFFSVRTECWPQPDLKQYKNASKITAFAFFGCFNGIYFPATQLPVAYKWRLTRNFWFVH